MAPGRGSDDDRRRDDEDRRNNSAGDDSKTTQQDNPFVRFRNSVDNIAASVFTDIAEAFPGLQKYVPPPNKSFFDGWAREAFRRFNDSYERSTNPERKGIERMSCYDDGAKSQDGTDLRNMGRRWEDRRNEVTSPQNAQDNTESSLTAMPYIGPVNIEDLLGIFGLPVPRLQTSWKPSRDYLRYSTYSPLQLEEQALTAENGSVWREAFEDLLRVEHGQPLLYADKEGYRNLRLPKEAWIDSLCRRQLLEPSHNGHHLLNILGIPSPDHDNEEHETAQNLSHDEPAEKRFLQQREVEDNSKATKEIATFHQYTNEQERVEEEERPSWTRCPGLLELADNEDEEPSDEGHDGSGPEDADKDERPNLPSETFTYSTQWTRMPDGGVSRSWVQRECFPDGSVVETSVTETLWPWGTTQINRDILTIDAYGAFQTSRSVERRDKPSQPWAEKAKAAKKDTEGPSPILEAAKKHQKETEEKKGGWFWSD